MKNKIGSLHWQTPGCGLVRSSLILVGVVSLLAATAQAAGSRVVITPAAGYTITWDGNNGGFSSGAAGAGPADNVALAAHGTTAFGSSEYGIVHFIPNINNGLYGNNYSWLPSLSDSGPYIGLAFAASVDIASVAWSRDNGNTVADACGGTCRDRCTGLYTLQYTTVSAPGTSTPETDDPATGWATIGTVEYLEGTDDIYFSAYLRHRFDVSQGGAPIAATGIRIKVAPGNAMDEIEVNPQPDPHPVEIKSMAGFTITWDGNDGRLSTTDSPAPVPVNDASVSRGAVAFTSTDLGPAINVPFHRAINLNDGLYGNAHSWIPDFVNGDPAPFAGIKFAQPLVLKSVAWGRDNGDSTEGVFTDRALGLYTLQVTTVPDPGAATPEACGPYPDLGWVTVGTIEYISDDPVLFHSYLRHRFDISQGGRPLVATGVRIKVPNSNSDIDEIEVNANLAIEGSAVLLTNAPGFGIAWDGNNGEYFSAAAGAAPPANRASVTEGTVAFTSSDLGPAIGISYHRAFNLNDGLYGNSCSWIPNFVGGDADPFAGLSFGGTVLVTNISWSRDNGNTATEGTFTDRNLGLYRLQYTTVAMPDASTADTGDAATGWADLGTVTYVAEMSGYFTPYLRHRFDLSAGGAPIEATGIRIKVPNSSIDIDEIEINSPLPPAPVLPPVSLNPVAGYAIAWDGNEAQFYSSGLAPVPPNRALASQGTVPFASSELGPVIVTNYHMAFNLNDGLFGNSNSWISANGAGGTSDPDPFAGLNFKGTVLITNIAWGRDNGDLSDNCTAGTCVDRSLGTYTLQVTTVPEPDATTAQTDDPGTGWATVATVTYNYSSPPAFTSYLRHRFDVSAGGMPIEATGLRIKVSDGWTAIDEIEVNTLIGPQPDFRYSGLCLM